MLKFGILLPVWELFFLLDALELVLPPSRLPTFPCSFCDLLLEVEGMIIWLKFDEAFWFWIPCIVGYYLLEILLYCCWAIWDLRPTDAVLAAPCWPSNSFSSMELLCLSGLSIEFIEFRAFYICSYCFLLMLADWLLNCYPAAFPDPSFRLKFTPEPN